MKARQFKTAFILGAGLGMRLRPLTERCPKPLLEAGGRPIVTYAMDHLLTAGVDRFIINTHHCPEVYFDKFPNGRWRGVPIVFRHESVLLDTAGGLKNIEDLLDEDQTILCYNGDVMADFPLRKLIQTHKQRQPESVLALRSQGPLLNVNVNERNEICDIRDILGIPGRQRCLFTGIYTLDVSMLNYIEPEKIESIISTFIQRIAQKPGSIIGSVIDEGNWMDIGSLNAYEFVKNKAALESH